MDEAGRGEPEAGIPEPAAEGVLRAAKVGAGWAFEQLWRTLAPPVAGYLRAQGAEDVEDLTSEVFLGVFRGIDRFEGTWPQFRSWVFTIAHHRLTDERRRRSRRPSAPVADPAALPSAVRAGDVVHDAMAALGSQRVMDLCALLPPDQRDVLLMRVVGDLTIEQVASALGRSPGAMKALQRRGLNRLRKLLASEGVPL